MEKRSAVDEQGNEEVKTNIPLDHPIGISSVDFHTTYQQEGPTASITKPATVGQVYEIDVRTHKITLCIAEITEGAVEGRLQVVHVDWHRWLLDKNFEILQLLEQINDSSATHLQALLKPTLVRTGGYLKAPALYCNKTNVYRASEESYRH